MYSHELQIVVREKERQFHQQHHSAVRVCNELSSHVPVEQDQIQEDIRCAKRMHSFLVELRKLRGDMLELCNLGYDVNATLFGKTQSLIFSKEEDIHDVSDQHELKQVRDCRQQALKCAWSLVPWLSWVPARVLYNLQPVEFVHEYAAFAPPKDELWLYTDEGFCEVPDKVREVASDLAHFGWDLQAKQPSLWKDKLPNPFWTRLNPVVLTHAEQQECSLVVTNLLRKCYGVIECQGACGPMSFFTCTDETCEQAVDGLLWRLSHVAQTSDTSRLEALMSTKVLFICFPEMLDSKQQDQLSLALGQIQKIPSDKLPFRICVVSAVPNSRFSNFLHAHGVVPDETLGVWDKTLLLSQHQCVFGAPLSGKTTLIRQQLDGKSRFDILIYRGMTQEDLVSAFERKPSGTQVLVIDCGSDLDYKAALLGMGLLSIFVCGIVGQTLRMPTSVSKIKIVFEVQGSNCDSIPPLCLLPDIKRANNVFEVGHAASSPSTWKLSESNVDVNDHEVFYALCEDLNNHACAAKIGQVEAWEHYLAADPCAYIHTGSSITTMAAVHARLMHFLRFGYDLGHIPIVLVGETGCGKTYLLQKLISFYQSIFLHCQFGSIRADIQKVRVSLNTLNHACTIPVLRDYFHNKQMRATADHYGYWFIILDELNTSAGMDFCKRFLFEGRFTDGVNGDGQVPRTMPVFATSNPNNDYDVFPLPPSVSASAISCNTLEEAEKFQLLRARLQEPEIDAIHAAQKLVTTHEGHAISMRDTMRCASMIDEKSVLSQLIECSHPQVPPEQIRQLLATLAIYLCYGMQLKDRCVFFQCAAVRTLCTPLDLQEYIHKLQDYSLSNVLDVPKHVIPTRLLGENVLATLCCVLTHQPLLIVGEAGMSKTLGVALVLNSMQGPYSKSELLQNQPRCETYRLQFSQTTKASHIEKLTEESIWHYDSSRSQDSVATFVLEELSMAKAGPRGPLKALHRLLDLPQHRNSSSRSNFIATSNYLDNQVGSLPVDKALCNRMLLLQHARPGIKMFRELVGGLMQSSRTQVHARQSIESLYTLMMSECEEASFLSVRDLLFFARHVVSQMEADVSWDQNLASEAFALHLQSGNKSEKLKRWEQYGNTIQPQLISGLRIPDVLVPSFCKTTLVLRHVLLSYNSVGAVCHQMMTRREFRKLKKYQSLVIIKCGSWPEDFQEHRVRPLLIEVKLALELGKHLIIVDPAPLLDSLHAILNADSSMSSGCATISYHTMHELVSIQESARILLLMDAGDVQKLHRSQISRVGVQHLTEEPVTQNPKSTCTLKGRLSLLDKCTKSEQCDLLSQLDVDLQDLVQDVRGPSFNIISVDSTKFAHPHGVTRPLVLSEMTSRDMLHNEVYVCITHALKAEQQVFLVDCFGSQSQVCHVLREFWILFGFAGLSLQDECLGRTRIQRANAKASRLEKLVMNYEDRQSAWTHKFSILLLIPPSLNGIKHELAVLDSEQDCISRHKTSSSRGKLPDEYPVTDICKYAWIPVREYQLDEAIRSHTTFDRMQPLFLPQHQNSKDCRKRWIDALMNEVKSGIQDIFKRKQHASKRPQYSIIKHIIKRHLLEFLPCFRATAGISDHKLAIDLLQAVAKSRVPIQKYGSIRSAFISLCKAVVYYMAAFFIRGFGDTIQNSIIQVPQASDWIHGILSARCLPWQVAMHAFLHP